MAATTRRVARALAAAALAAMLAGCGSPTTGQINATAAPPAAPSVTAQPSPVSNSATLSGTCTLGFEWPNGDGGSGPFITQLPGIAARQAGDYGRAYQVTLTNNGTATADVTGFALVFYVRAGTLETGSDQQQVNETFITTGQSLTWTEVAPNTVNGQESVGGSDSSIPADATSCQFLQWYSGG